MSTNTLDVDAVVAKLNGLKKSQAMFTWTKEKAQYNEALDDAIETIRAIANPDYVRPRRHWAGPY